MQKNRLNAIMCGIYWNLLMSCLMLICWIERLEFLLRSISLTAVESEGFQVKFQWNRPWFKFPLNKFSGKNFFKLPRHTIPLKPTENWAQIGWNLKLNRLNIPHNLIHFTNNFIHRWIFHAKTNLNPANLIPKEFPYKTISAFFHRSLVIAHLWDCRGNWKSQRLSKTISYQIYQKLHTDNMNIKRRRRRL